MKAVASFILRTARAGSVRPLNTVIRPRTAFPSVAARFQRPLIASQQRWMSASAAVSKEDAEKRIMKVLSSFDKVGDPSKITPTASFTKDLGLDSLDAVEVVMAIEEEFGIEIPDDDADKILGVGDAVSYIIKNPNGRQHNDSI